ncbi:MAG TPA: hypothetical protein VMU58_03685 [Gaiellaceae bacterium]|nr:hypothetical protein [Gaiellaceae bacterium]
MRLTLIAATCFAALALASGASAGLPRFAIFDVRTDLAAASHNEYGDVKVWKREAALAKRTHGGLLVRCGGDCTFGAGWLAFVHGPALAAADVASAKATHSRAGWNVVLTLTSKGHARLAGFTTKAKARAARRGIADPLALVLDGSIVAQPLQTQLQRGKTTVAIPGLTRATALRVAKLLGP